MAPAASWRVQATVPGAPDALGAVRVTSTAVFDSFSASMGCCFSPQN